MESSYRFFENRDCKYFPCHEGLKDFNCLFCYCPMYHIKNCPGNPEFMDIRGKSIIVCSNCTFQHQPEHYDAIIEVLKRKNE